MSAEAPEADRLPGAPHPRETLRLLGQERAEAEALAAWRGGRLHHAWMLTGPRGSGKATLAWRLARALLAAGPQAPDSLDVPADHPVARRIGARAEPRLHLVRREFDEKAGRLQTAIGVEAIRRLKGFFQVTAADGGRRVAIVDAADDLNPNAQNALLKLLEEPPAGAVLLLVAHQPGRLLPTIRSRMRPLRLGPLGPADLAQALGAAGADPADLADGAGPLAALSGGSVGEALRLVAGGGLESYRALVRLMSSLPRLDRPAALALAETAAGRGREAELDLLLGLLDLFLARLARAGISGPPRPEAAPGEAALLARLAPDHARALRAAALHERLGARARHARAVNLDPAALLMDMFLEIEAGL